MRKIAFRFILAALLPAAMLLSGCRSTQVKETVIMPVAETSYQLRVTHVETVKDGASDPEPENVEDTLQSSLFRVELTAVREINPLDPEEESNSIAWLEAGLEETKRMTLLRSESPWKVLIRKDGKERREIATGTLVKGGVLMSARIDHYDAETATGKLRGEVIVVKGGSVVLHKKMDAFPFENEVPIVLEKPEKPDEDKVGEKIPLWEDAEGAGKFFDLLARAQREAVESVGKEGPQRSYWLQVSHVWEGEGYCPVSLREGIREKKHIQSFNLSFRHIQHWGGSWQTTEASTGMLPLRGEMSYLRALSFPAGDITGKVLIREDETGELTVGELVTGGSTVGFRVDSYDSESGRGAVSGEFIAIENGLVDIYTQWENLPFVDGEWILLGGEESHREEMERYYEIKREFLEIRRREEKGENQENEDS